MDLIIPYSSDFTSIFQGMQKCLRLSGIKCTFGTSAYVRECCVYIPWFNEFSERSSLNFVYLGFALFYIMALEFHTSMEEFLKKWLLVFLQTLQFHKPARISLVFGKCCLTYMRTVRISHF